MKLPKLRWLLLGVGVVIVLVAVVQTARRFLERDRDRVRNQVLEARAREEGGIAGELVSERAAKARLEKENRELAAFVVALKMAVPKSRVDSVSRARITIQDTAKSITTRATETAPARICDEFNRFCFDLPGGLLHREQDIRVNTAVVVSPDGKARVAKTEFHEHDPTTGLEIPSTGLKVKSSLEFTQEKGKKPPILHLRGLFGADIRGALAGGVEFANLERTEWPFFERLTGSVVGYWKAGERDGRVAGKLGYRVLGNIVVGPYIGASIPDGTLVAGASAVVQVTR